MLTVLIYCYNVCYTTSITYLILHELNIIRFYSGELTGGLTSVRSAGKILEAAENDWSSVQKRLERIRDCIVRQDKNTLLVSS